MRFTGLSLSNAISKLTSLGPTRGEIIPLPVSALKGSPFETYFSTGLILFCLGLGPLAAALLAWLRHPLAPIAALGVGVALLIWMAVEIAIVGYGNNPPLQPFLLAPGSRDHRRWPRLAGQARTIGAALGISFVPLVHRAH